MFDQSFVKKKFGIQFITIAALPSFLGLLCHCFFSFFRHFTFMENQRNLSVFPRKGQVYDSECSYLSFVSLAGYICVCVCVGDAMIELSKREARTRFKLHQVRLKSSEEIRTAKISARARLVRVVGLSYRPFFCVFLAINAQLNNLFL
jgi:hypothetical protein